MKKPEKLLTGNALAVALRTYPHHVQRALNTRAIVPDFTAGRLFLFRPARLPKLRAAIAASAK
jgi:hypothetical protein